MKLIMDLNALRQKSEDIFDVSEIQSILKSLEEELAMHTNGIGLSAIQIGIPKKVALIKDGDTTTVLVNACILDAEEPIVFYREGCLSIPDIYSNTNRYHHVVINNHVIESGALREEKQYYYFSKDKQDSIYGSNPITTVAVQHEIEHFDGKLIVDHVVNEVKSVKIGRNDLCPCNSGKKYKKCCLNIIR